MLTLPDLIGSIGTAAYITSYVMLQSGKMSGDGAVYTVLNLIGASFVLFSLVAGDWNLASAMIQGFWIIVSVYGLVRMAALKSKPQSEASSL